MTPDDRKYAATHEWVKIEDDLAVVGITDHAQHELGDITFVELPELGDSVEAKGEVAVVESVKAASDIFTPVTGVVVEANDSLTDAPEKLNQDPYGDGWIFKLKGVAPGELDSLMSAAEYEAQL